MYTPKYVNYMFEMFKIKFILCCFQYVLKKKKPTKIIYIYIYIYG